jgi:hypothetical protein
MLEDYPDKAFLQKASVLINKRKGRSVLSRAAAKKAGFVSILPGRSEMPGKQLEDVAAAAEPPSSSSDPEGTGLAPNLPPQEASQRIPPGEILTLSSQNREQKVD